MLSSEALVRALADLSYAATKDFAAEAMLQQLCTVAGSAVVVDGAGVMITESTGNRFVHATTTTVAPLERLQESLAGPCQDAADASLAVVDPDLTKFDRWPDYRSLAADLGIGSVASLPLVSRGRTWGVLDLYRHSPGWWTEAELEVAALMADVAVSYLVIAADRDAARYQPIVTSSAPHRVVAVEALLRWRHPDGPVMSAATFIDLAVRSGLITAFGRWVIDQTCEQMYRWSDEFGADAPAVAYINLSARELADVALPDTLQAAMTKHHLQTSQIGLEIIEEDLADADVVVRLGGYAARGHPPSIDDFGTGYSSLSRLLDLPVDMAKIDKSFVDGIAGDTRRTGLIDAVLTVADKLGIAVIAEGVETLQQLRHLTAAGCHLLQGYLLGRPQPAEALTASWAAGAAS